MALITYPLDSTDYSADDAALFHATRISGIYAGDDFPFSLTGADNIITLGVGLAWMRLARFKGVVTALKAETNVDMGISDSTYPRIDHIVLQYDANKNSVDVVVKKGAASSSPLPPERSTSETLYELHLLQVYRKPGAVVITAADVTDLRLDTKYCGLMADSVTQVDTAAINAQITALINQLRTDLANVEAGSAYEFKKIQFNNVSVLASSFVEDASCADYPYRTAVELEGVLASMIPEVFFGIADAVCGNYAPVTESYDGGVYLYAGNPPNEDITIPTIVLWRGNA